MPSLTIGNCVSSCGRVLVTMNGRLVNLSTVRLPGTLLNVVMLVVLMLCLVYSFVSASVPDIFGVSTLSSVWLFGSIERAMIVCALIILDVVCLSVLIFSMWRSVSSPMMGEISLSRFG